MTIKFENLCNFVAYAARNKDELDENSLQVLQQLSDFCNQEPVAEDVELQISQSSLMDVCWTAKSVRDYIQNELKENLLEDLLALEIAFIDNGRISYDEEAMRLLVEAIVSRINWRRLEKDYKEVSTEKIDDTINNVIDKLYLKLS